MIEHSLIYMTNLYNEAMDLNTKLMEELENLKDINEEHKVLNGKLREENKRLKKELQEENPTSPLKERLWGFAKVISKIGYLGAILVSLSYLFI